MTRDQFWHLKNFNIFDAVSDAEIDHLQEMINTDWIKHKDPVFLSDEPSRWVFFLKQGLVKLSLTSPEGRSLTVALLKPGEVFGELTSSESSDDPLEAIALEDSYLCRIRREVFQQFLQEHPATLQSVNKLLGLRIRRVQTAVSDMVFLGVEARLAKVLDELATKEGEETTAGIRIPFRLTHQEIASLIGASREIVSSLLSRFTKQGWIRQEKRRIYVLDIPSLRRLFT